MFYKDNKKEVSNPRKVTDFLKNYSLRDNLVSEDCQMSCFVLQIYKKSVKTHAVLIFYYPKLYRLIHKLLFCAKKLYKYSYSFSLRFRELHIYLNSFGVFFDIKRLGLCNFLFFNINKTFS